MKRFVTVSLVIMVLLSAAISASARTGSLNTNNVSVKNGRLFEVRVSAHDARSLGSGIFTLEYDSADINYRDITSENGEVRAYDSGGKTKVVFLCENGLNLTDNTELFTVTYKKISDSDAEIRLKCTEFIDDEEKSAACPSATVCRVNAIVTDKTSYSQRSARRSSLGSSPRKRNKASAGSSPTGKSSETTAESASDSKASALKHDFRSKNDDFIGIAAIAAGSILLTVTLTVFLKLILKKKK